MALNNRSKHSRPKEGMFRFFFIFPNIFKFIFLQSSARTARSSCEKVHARVWHERGIFENVSGGKRLELQQSCGKIYGTQNTGQNTCRRVAARTPALASGLFILLFEITVTHIYLLLYLFFALKYFFSYTFDPQQNDHVNFYTVSFKKNTRPAKNLEDRVMIKNGLIKKQLQKKTYKKIF